MYLGRFQLGTRVPFRLQCLDGEGGSNALPDNPPWCKVWNSSGSLVASFEMPVSDRYSQTGLFLTELFLGRDYSAGQYSVTYSYRNSTYHGRQQDTFEVIAGGHADGAVVAMHFYVLPHATYVVQQLESGKIVQGRNPKVD